MNPHQFFTKRFHALTGNSPLGWQERLFLDHFLNDDIPATLDLPTGLGKTSVMAIWYVALRTGARLPRRLVYVVDRRAVVDQATTIADEIKAKSCDSALHVSTLRGRHVDNRAWLEDPAVPAIIVGTVDMIGSRLLFSGYGVSRKMRPYHAGLLGTDTLVVLDESHLVPPFERLLEAIEDDTGMFGPHDEADQKVVPRFKLLSLSATGRVRQGRVFRLEEADAADPIVAKRLGAKKRLSIVETNGKKFEEALTERVWALSSEGTKAVRCLIYCNSRNTAEKSKAAIEKLAKGKKIAVETELFVGARRVKERVDAAGRLTTLGFLAGSGVAPARPAFLIATSAGEVGVDLDADHMVCDLVPWERMVQRLGRVNRRGNGDARIVLVHEGEPTPKKPDEPKPDELRAMIAWRSRIVLDSLPAHDGGIDVSPGALRKLKQRAEKDAELGRRIDTATTSEPLRPALTRALIDAWSMTSLERHTGRPEVQPWLRGWVEDDGAQTTLVWRKYLPVRLKGGEASQDEMNDFFAAAPPHLAEILETETLLVRDWLLARVKKLADALAKDEQKNTIEGPALTPLSEKSIVCIALGRAGEEKRYYTLACLIEAEKDKKDKKALERALGETTLVLDVRLGGLNDGLLKAEADCTPVSAADGENGWFDPETEKPLVPFRVRRVKLGENDEAPTEEDGAKWQSIHAFDVERDADDKPLLRLVVEKWRGETPDEDARSVSSCAQPLKEHQEWAADKAKVLVEALQLQDDLANAIVLAARLHDEGKKAERWQNAFRTPANGRPYAKTASRRPPDFTTLGGYRHEFGSLFHVEKDDEFGALPDDLKDFVLHLVVAHHGRARPVIETEGCEDGPPAVLEARARDVALRFARLQKRWGPWGLAWWEALLRAADQQASRDNDAREGTKKAQFVIRGHGDRIAPDLPWA